MALGFDCARQHADGEINVQQFLIACKETADDAVCYDVTESTGAAVRKGLGSGKLLHSDSVVTQRR